MPLKIRKQTKEHSFSANYLEMALTQQSVELLSINGIIIVPTQKIWKKNHGTIVHYIYKYLSFELLPKAEYLSTIFRLGPISSLRFH